MRVGVLALQGNYFQHKQMCARLGVQVNLIKYPHQLDKICALIIPGGESSVISKLIEKNNFREAIINFSKVKSIFGTCAGMILLSSTKKSSHVAPLNVMDFTIDRNAWGRQVDSFSAHVSLRELKKSFYTYFIRSPRIKRKGNKIKVLAFYENEPVLLTDGRHLAASFHPEIGNDMRIHQYFIKNLYESS